MNPLDGKRIERVIVLESAAPALLGAIAFAWVRT
jgi:hypothetical protein